MTNRSRKVKINDLDILFITAGLIALVEDSKKDTSLLPTEKSLERLCITEQSLRLLKTLRESKNLSDTTIEFIDDTINAIAKEYSLAVGICVNGNISN